MQNPNGVTRALHEHANAFVLALAGRGGREIENARERIDEAVMWAQQHIAGLAARGST